MTIKIKHKRGTASAITSANPTLSAGELAFETDTRRFKVGDGTTAWSSLSYVTPYVTATDRLLGRSSSGAGAAEEIPCGSFGRSLISSADAAAARTTLSVQPTASPAFTGAATFTVTSGSSVPVTISNSGSGNSLVVATNLIVDAAGRVGFSGAPRAFEAFSVLGTAPSSLSASLGFRVQCTYPSSTTADAASFSSFPQTQAANYTLTNLYHFGSFFNGIGAGSTVTNQYAYYADSTCVGATNNYGFYSGLGSGTGRWAFYGAGTAPSYFGGQLLVTAGSASACGVAFSGDPDTGIAQLSAAGANTLSICTNSAERVRVDASGNVGIGVAPAALLDLGSTGGVKVFTYKSGGANAGIGTDLSGAAFECSLFAGGTADTHGRISFGRRRVDTGTYTEWMRIENDGVVRMIDVYGDTVGATNRDLFIDDTGKLGYVSSIRASKTDIESIDDVSWLRDLTPVSFRYRKRNEDGTYSDDADGTRDYGLIAEDVEPVAPDLCFYDVVDGEPQLRGVHYSKLITPMLRYIQQLEARIAALEEKINA